MAGFTASPKTVPKPLLPSMTRLAPLLCYIPRPFRPDHVRLNNYINV
jgi:hypothetical protein